MQALSAEEGCQQVRERLRAINDQMMAGGGNGLWKALLSPGDERSRPKVPAHVRTLRRSAGVLWAVTAPG